jgi:hypothetical protein
MIIFYSVQFLYKKKVIKLNFLKKNLNRTKTGSNRPVSVWFFGQKPVQTDRFRFGFLDKNRFKPTGFGLVFWIGSVFFRFGSVLAHFFGLGSIRFFRFQAYKIETKSNRLIFLKF